jgi:hypothetical protein
MDYMAMYPRRYNCCETLDSYEVEVEVTVFAHSSFKY